MREKPRNILLPPENIAQRSENTFFFIRDLHFLRGDMSETVSNRQKMSDNSLERICVSRKILHKS